MSKAEQAARFALAQAAREELARRKFLDYCTLVHRGAWQPAAHHRLIADALQRVCEGRCKRLMVWMPPRHGKSMEITETFPSYFLGKFPQRRVIEVSYNDDLARRFGRANRQKLEEYGKKLFGISLAQGNRSAADFGIAGHRGGMLSVGLGGAITGQGADLLLIDDPVKNREEADSPAYRRRLLAEYRSTLYTRLHPGGSVVIVMTRWHEEDLCGTLLLQGEPFEVLALPAIAESGDVLGRAPGEPLWPQHGFDAAWAQETRRTIGSYAWAALYQQRPAPEEGGLFKRSWWRRYAPEELPPLACTVLSVDAAFKDTDDSVAIHAWGKSGANMYLLERCTRRMDFPNTLLEIRRMHARHRPQRTLIEDKANGPAIIAMLHDTLPGIVPVNPQGGKIARAHAVSAAIEAGNVYLPAGRDAQELIEQCAAFPNGAHDDDVDAMTQALNHLLYADGTVPQPVRAVHWEQDQYEDYANASPAQRELLLQRWGDPFAACDARGEKQDVWA